MNGRTIKAISVLQPWTWAIVYGGKPVENRDWYTSYRGPLAIHASSRRSWEECLNAGLLIESRGIPVKPPQVTVKMFGRQTRIANWPEELVCGAVIAIADLVDCVRQHPSKWFVGRYGLVLANVRPLARPVPAKGALSLWDWEVPAEAVLLDPVFGRVSHTCAVDTALTIPSGAARFGGEHGC